MDQVLHGITPDKVTRHSKDETYHFEGVQTSTNNVFMAADEKGLLLVTEKQIDYWNLW